MVLLFLIKKNAEIKDLRLRIQAELFGVLTEKEQHNFNLDKALEHINNEMGILLLILFH